MFHTHNKLLIIFHNQEIYRQMGRLVAQGKNFPPDQLFDAYEQLLLKALGLKTQTYLDPHPFELKLRNYFPAVLASLSLPSGSVIKWCGNH